MNKAINFALDIQEFVQKNGMINQTSLMDIINKNNGNIALDGSIYFEDGSATIWDENSSSWVML